MKPLSRHKLIVTILVAMIATHGYIFWNLRKHWIQGYGDFSSFYTAGSLVLRGQSRQLYNRDAQWNLQQEFASEVKIRHDPLPYVRPPYEALFFVPFALWSYPVGLLLWTGCKIILLFLIPLIVGGGGRWRNAFPPWAVSLLSFGTLPVFMDMLQGQDSVLLAFLFAIAFWQFREGRDRWAGVTLGLGLFKFHFVLPFVAIALVAGRKKLAAGFIFMGAVVVAVSAALVGWRALVQYPRYLFSLNRSSSLGFVTPEYQINLRGLLTFFVGRTARPGPVHLLLLPIALIAIAYVGSLWRKAGNGMLAEGFGLALITSIVTSYYAYSYDLTSLAVPLLGAGRRPTHDSDRLASYLEGSGVFLLLFAPLYWVVKGLQAEYLMVLPLIGLGWGLIRRLRRPSGAGAAES